MLSIGEFSKICEVSTKTLRYYDEIDLIKPIEVNPDNNYRYYSVDQIKTMFLIIRLKEYDFSLEEIKEILIKENLSLKEDLSESLKLKRKNMNQKLKNIKMTLKQIEKDIQTLENDQNIIKYPEIKIEIIKTQPLNILYIKEKIDYKNGYFKYFKKLYEKLIYHKLTANGYPITIYHSKEYNPDGNETEFAIPVKEKTPKTRILKGETCAKSTLKGPYPDLKFVYAKLTEWIETKKYKLSSSPYEIYITNPNETKNLENLITEVYFPIKKEDL
ncbi:MerR family transcriptional regulator [Oceanotoga sp. DSM 15011]|uniref:MerR family transcriptional regulator n=1 Tax=Oceanotoga sp. DSM 15011 TaxID=2984951 RepID=UPI0021F4D88B|nr:MerR family transcriptional regulator [Oceanotoga sp. DSM 15011]UYP01313.1 MerR family transcriptional regulator [Oceanotoga sp. DSM 15011]